MHRRRRYCSVVRNCSYFQSAYMYMIARMQVLSLNDGQQPQGTGSIAHTAPRTGEQTNAGSCLPSPIREQLVAFVLLCNNSPRGQYLTRPFTFALLTLVESFASSFCIRSARSLYYSLYSLFILITTHPITIQRRPQTKKEIAFYNGESNFQHPACTGHRVWDGRRIRDRYM